MKYLSDVTLAQRYDVSRATIWRWSRQGKLPHPIKLSPGTTRWRLADIEQHDQKVEGGAK